MPLAAARSLYEATGPHDVIVDLIGVSSNHGVGTILVDIDVAEPQPQQGCLSIIRGRRRRRPRFIIPDEPPQPQPGPDVVVDLVGVSSNRGAGRVTIVTPFDLTDDEMLALIMLIS
jgi:hypothetical protein